MLWKWLLKIPSREQKTQFACPPWCQSMQWPFFLQVSHADYIPPLSVSRCPVLLCPLFPLYCSSAPSLAGDSVWCCQAGFPLLPNRLLTLTVWDLAASVFHSPVVSLVSLSKTRTKRVLNQFNELYLLISCRLCSLILSVIRLDCNTEQLLHVSALMQFTRSSDCETISLTVWCAIDFFFHFF